MEPGSSSQYSMHWLHLMPAHWTQTVHCFDEEETRRGEGVTRSSPRLVRGGRQRRPRRRPAWGTLLRDLASLLQIKHAFLLGYVFKGNSLVFIDRLREG